MRRSSSSFRRSGGRSREPSGCLKNSAHWVFDPQPGFGDRKSTRLNSSHLGTSYAVFCLKKKIQKSTIPAADTTPATRTAYRWGAAEGGGGGEGAGPASGRGRGAPYGVAPCAGLACGPS